MISGKYISLQTTKEESYSITSKNSFTTKNSMMFQLTESVLSSDFRTYMVLKELLEDNIKELKQEVVHIQQINNSLENSINSIYQLKKEFTKWTFSFFKSIIKYEAQISQSGKKDFFSSTCLNSGGELPQK
ncbi:Hypothetical_protein [Hexamita inflata]|uniref:Hypothetical_protein n=1 Tax=Hexamita inflata TaxID=28002 RepID=A0AA86P2J4_9EUKA|nr:Hypothetical protein HINF_LOCUS18424 [Hexamita inflata]